MINKNCGIIGDISLLSTTLFIKMNKIIKTVKSFFNTENLKVRAFYDVTRSKVRAITPNMVEFNLLLVPQSEELIDAVSHLYEINPLDNDFGVVAKVILSVKNDAVIGGYKKPRNLMGDLKISVSSFSKHSESLQSVKYHFTPFTPLSINDNEGVYQAGDCTQRFLTKLEADLIEAYRRLAYAHHLSNTVRQNFDAVGAELDGGVNRGCCNLLIKENGINLKTSSDGTVTIVIPEGTLSESQLSRFLLEAVA